MIARTILELARDLTTAVTDDTAACMRHNTQSH
jgi:hypothetical protein